MIGSTSTRASSGATSSWGSGSIRRQVFVAGGDVAGGESGDLGDGLGVEQHQAGGCAVLDASAPPVVQEAAGEVVFQLRGAHTARTTCRGEECDDDHRWDGAD